MPISSFPARDHSLRRLFLFHSMAEANMNSLRVWGGGIYEQEEFYDLADQLGNDWNLRLEEYLFISRFYHMAGFDVCMRPLSN